MTNTSLADDTPIYRVFNIYDLITTIENQQLRLAQAAAMADKDEVLGEYLLTLNSIFGPQTEIGNRTCLDQHLLSQSAQYMSCWTRSPDNIAVWSLYSPSYEGILVRSTVGKLKTALDTFYQEHNFGIAYSLEPNDKRDLFYPPDIDQVQYVDFSELLKQLLGVRESYNKHIDAMLSVDASPSADKIGKAMKWLSESSERLFAERGLSVKVASLIKGSRYEHEKEVRAIIRLVRRDHRTSEEYQRHPLAGLDGPVRMPRAEECPANIFVPLASDFIQDLQMDGRSPAWRRAATQLLFKKLGFDITPNTAFTSTPDREDWRRSMGGLFR